MSLMCIQILSAHKNNSYTVLKYFLLVFSQILRNTDDFKFQVRHYSNDCARTFFFCFKADKMLDITFLT